MTADCQHAPPNPQLSHLLATGWASPKDPPSILRHAFAAGFTILSLFSWGCAGADDRSGEVVHRDSAGVTLALNNHRDVMLDWTLEPIIDMGGAQEGPSAFFRVFETSVGADSSGNLYVLDAGNYRVSVFDRAGRHLRSFGRQGEGPGELTFPSDMAVTPAGEVAVYDFGRRALVHFDRNGSFTGTFPLPGPLQRKVVLLEGARIAAAVTLPAATADSTDFALLAFGDDTVEVARIRQISQPQPQQFSCMTLALPPYFQPRIEWASAGDRIVLSMDGSYSIHVFDSNRLSAIWKRDLPLIPATLDLAAWEVASGDSLRFRGCAVPAHEAARQFGYADVAPIVDRLAVLTDGGVWLRRRTETPGEFLIDVLDATGAYVGSLPGDAPFPALFRGTEEFVVVEKDDFDVPHVVVYRIGGRS